MTPQAPGVYVQEVPSGVRLVQGVATACAAFLDPQYDGEPQFIRNWQEWEELNSTFGEVGAPGANLGDDEFLSAPWDNRTPASTGEPASTYVPAAIRGWFENGGGPCYRVAVDDNYSATENMSPFASGDGGVDDAGGEDDTAAEPEQAEAPSYQGSRANGTGLAELEALEDVTIVIAPDLWFGTEEQAKLNARAMAAHCAKMRNRMTVLHLQEGLGDRAALELTPLITEDDSAKFSALYYPWLEVFDNAGEKMYVPPVGHVAGMWARVDGKRGVHKAPANEVLQGVLDLEKNLMDEEQAELNEKGLNCIRSFRGQGIRVWGARTQVDSSDVDWRYINVRRLCNFIQESIRVSSRWAIFEPNDERLWSSLRGNVSVFLRDQWRAGALAGATPSDAYYVICDETNNDPTSIAAGEVYCDIGIAAVRPGEFITFRVTQIVGGPES